MKIDMAHGSGGLASEELMRDVFGKYFSNETLDKMEDAAFVPSASNIICSTDTFVVDPIIFRGGDIGKLAVCGTVNDILVMGGVPKYLTCGFILQTGLEVEILERVVKSMAETAKAAGVTIIAGDTKVVEGSGGMFVNTTGIGFAREGINISASNCEVGDELILSGNLGDHHAAILSERMKIENDITSDCALLNDITDTLFENNIKIKTMRDVTRGGLGTILNEIARASDCHIVMEEESLPVSKATRGFADILGLDPLYMGNEGKMIVIVQKGEGEKALELIRKTKNGADAKIIGVVEEKSLQNGPELSIKTPLGATRKVDVLVGEGLPRIC